MAQDLKQLFQEFVDMPHEKRVAFGKISLGNALEFLEKQGVEEKQLLSFMLALVSIFVSADRKCSKGEYELFIDMTGFNVSPQEFYDLTNVSDNSAYIRDVKSFIKSLPSDIQKHLFFFGLTMLAADEELTIEEQKFLLEVFAGE